MSPSSGHSAAAGRTAAVGEGGAPGARWLSRPLAPLVPLAAPVLSRPLGLPVLSWLLAPLGVSWLGGALAPPAAGRTASSTSRMTRRDHQHTPPMAPLRRLHARTTDRLNGQRRRALQNGARRSG